MIGYLEGDILQLEADAILLKAGHVGYEILLSPLLAEKIQAQQTQKETIGLYIYTHQTERQPKPVLIGFETPEDKAFFQLFITVDAIGPMKAAKALSRPASEVARAIEKKEVKFLTGLSGIGKRTAEKIIATLHGKVEKFIGQLSAGEEPDDVPMSETLEDIARQVADVLVEQLGHSPASARRLINEAIRRNSNIASPEALFDEIYQENT